MTKKTIVLAEDDASLRKLYTDFLSANGFNVLAAANGLDTLSLLHRVQPRLVLLDIMMPDLNGIEVCRRARTFVDPKTPIVFLSSLDFAEHVSEGLKAGGDDYIIKTTRLDTILERITYWSNSQAKIKSERRREKALTEIRRNEAPQDSDGAPVEEDQSTV